MRAEPDSKPQRGQIVHESLGEIDFVQVFASLRREKWWIALYTALAIALGLVYVFKLATPLYTASTTVALQGRNQQVVDFNQVVSGLGGDIFTINTEVETLQSRTLIEKLVKKLNLTEDPVFNYQLRPSEEDGFSLSITDLVTSAVGMMRSATGGAEESKPSLPPTENQIFEDVVDAVMGSIEISNVMESYVFQITITKNYF